MLPSRFSIYVWLRQYRAEVLACGWPAAWAWVLAQPGDLTRQVLGYRPLTILPEGVWLGLMLTLVGANLWSLGRGALTPTRPQRGWRIGVAAGGATLWLGLGLVLLQAPILSAGGLVYLWIGAGALLHAVLLLVYGE